MATPDPSPAEIGAWRLARATDRGDRRQQRGRGGDAEEEQVGQEPVQLPQEDSSTECSTNSVSVSREATSVSPSETPTPTGSGLTTPSRPNTPDSAVVTFGTTDRNMGRCDRDRRHTLDSAVVTFGQEHGEVLEGKKIELLENNEENKELVKEPMVVKDSEVTGKVTEDPPPPPKVKTP